MGLMEITSDLDSFRNAVKSMNEGKQVAYIVCNEKVISVIGYRENE